jgi:hypothetical protein
MRKYDDLFNKAIRTAADLGASETVLERLAYVRENWSYPFSPKETLQIFFESQGLTDALTRDEIARRKEESIPSDVQLDLRELSARVPEPDINAELKSEDEGLIEIDNLRDLEEMIR